MLQILLQTLLLSFTLFLQVLMASASFGDGNRGFQAHTVNGSVSTTFNLHSGKPPAGSAVRARQGPSQR